MKQKNLVKKAVFPALVALLCSVIALTSVSYAWFTMGDKASVETLNMQVTTAAGLQISASGSEGSFKSNLLLSDLNAVESNNIPNTAVVPVSTDGKVKENEVVFYNGTIEDGSLTKAVKSTGDFIVFDIYLKVAAGKTLQLDKDSVVASVTKDTHLATRVAFYHLGNATTAAGAKSLTLSDESSFKIWEPNAKIRSGAVKDAGNTTDGSVLGYRGITSVSESGVPTLTTDVISVITPNQGADLKTSAATDLFDLGEGFNKIRVYIWLEGQDVDCVNEVSGGAYSVTLNFIQRDTNPQQ